MGALALRSLAASMSPLAPRPPAPRGPSSSSMEPNVDISRASGRPPGCGAPPPPPAVAPHPPPPPLFAADAIAPVGAPDASGESRTRRCLHTLLQ